MRETAAELRELQVLIDRSHANTKPHMRGIIHPGKYSLTATQVVKLIDGMKTIAVAAPAPNGDPLIGPMDGWFLHGRFFFSSGGDAVRIKGLRKRPRASVAYYEGEKFCITAHGHAELMFRGHPESARSMGSSAGTTGEAHSIGARTVCTFGSTRTASTRTPAHPRRSGASGRAPRARPPAR